MSEGKGDWWVNIKLTRENAIEIRDVLQDEVETMSSCMGDSLNTPEDEDNQRNHMEVCQRTINAINKAVG